MNLPKVIVRNLPQGAGLAREDDLVIVYANRRLEQTFGYAAGAMEGLSLRALSEEFAAPWMLSELQEAGVATYEIQAQGAKRDKFRFRGRTVCSLDPGQGMMWVVLDQGEPKPLEGSWAESDLARLYHDLRAPAHAIIGFADLLREGRAGPVAELQQELLGDILESARRLLERIDRGEGADSRRFATRVGADHGG